MQVFKLCLKIIKKNTPTLLIYIVIFLTISTIISVSYEEQVETSFNPVKTEIAFISKENTHLINGFKAELANIANFVDIPDQTEALQDALYFRSVSYILRIPEGFTDKFMNGENLPLEKISVHDSISTVYIDLCIDNYFNTARLYVQNMDGITQQELVQYLKTDFSEVTSIEIKTNRKKASNMTFSNYFFNYFAYSLFSVILLGMSSLILVFNNHDLKMRNSCSPIGNHSISIQFILANLTFTLASWMIMVSLCFVINYNNSFNLNTVLYITSSFVFAFCCSSISFLVGNLVKSKEALIAVTNVLTLGMCFISGVFVPQEFIGSQVLKIASFMPTYWYVKANNTISTLTQFDLITIKPVLYDFLIIIGFALAFFSVALAIRKRKQFSEA